MIAKKTFQITIQPSGERFTVKEDEFILDAAIAQGLSLPHSCRGGSCHSCKSKVTVGEFEYPNGQPWSLDDADIEGRDCLICLARAKSDMQILAKPIATPANIKIKKLPCRVEKKELLCHDVMAVYLRLPKVEAFEFLAGQYIDIVLPDGRRRSFSLANPPHDTELLELHIRKVPKGDFTTRVFEELPVRSLLRMEGPIGTFFIRKEHRRPIVMVAGGTGLAPLKGMLRDLLEDEKDDHGVHLFWGARAKEDLYQHEWLLEMASKHRRFMYTPILSEAKETDKWKGRTGWVHEAVLEEYPRLKPMDVYMAGPPPMIEIAKIDFAKAGLPDAQLYYDSFEFGADVALLAT